MPTYVCRCCQLRFANRPRGLCWSCYYRPGVREQFPSTSKFASKGVGIFVPAPGPAAEPTLALPGSPAKVAVLEERARLHQDLWHPQDAVTIASHEKMCGRPSNFERAG
jgi:hypothetical protein